MTGLSEASARIGDRSGGNGRTTALPKAGLDIAQAVAQVGRSDSAERVKGAVGVLEEARRKLYSILARASS